MTKSFRHLALVSCITAAAAFGGQIAAADTTSLPTRAEARGGQPQQHKWRRGQEERLGKMARELGLTDQQKGQAKALYEKNRDAYRESFGKLRNERKQLRALVMSGSADEAAIRVQSAKVSSVQADLAVMRAQGVKQFLALLTPEQVKKFKAMQEKRDAGFQRFRTCCEKEMKK